MKLQRITPCLWFNQNAEEAVNLYTGIFKNSSIGTIARYGKNASKGAQMPEGSIMTMAFELDGQKFLALNGGPLFSFTHAVSFVVNCDNQQEIDHYWAKLAEGGSIEQCGWLKDRFGLSWQVVPTQLGEFMKNEQKADKVMDALLKMKKLDLAELEKAAMG